ncbi:MAG: carboxypeptidase regulatory-like domain-containing protein [Acidobacteria bacterium]|nr:carboxypeptidase regulatory-like domain-containing protein [Acidobacteriota bacterium]MBV9669454.1 carboxypeptidase regulatory-like domain-containing protein [Terriglobales bacterium]
MRTARQILILICALMSLVCSFYGQRAGSGAGKLKGVVVDEHGWVIQKAKIVIYNSRRKLITVSDGEGNFEIGVPPGLYRVHVGNVMGFAPLELRNVRVRKDPATTVKATLKVMAVGPCLNTKPRQGNVVICM